MNWKEIEDIANHDTYSWVKIKKGPTFKAETEEDVNWKSEYLELCSHHMTETNFLINKCRELAQNLIDQEEKRIRIINSV